LWGALQAAEEAEVTARELVDMALLLGWLQVEDYGALLGLLTQPNEVPLTEGKDALAGAGLYVELVRC
jgi:hypothetical protein